MPFYVKYNAASSDEINSLTDQAISPIEFVPPEVRSLDDVPRFWDKGYLLQSQAMFTYAPKAARFLRELPKRYRKYHVLLGELPHNFLAFYLSQCLSVVGYKNISLYEPFSSYGPFGLLLKECWPSASVTLHDADPIAKRLERYYDGVTSIVGMIPDTVPDTSFDWTIIGANSIRYLTLDQAREFFSRLKTTVLTLTVNDIVSEEYYPEFEGVKAHWIRTGDGRYELSHRGFKYDVVWNDYPAKDLLQLVFDSGYVLLKQEKTLFTFTKT
jgi:hypothetical protein